MLFLLKNSKFAATKRKGIALMLTLFFIIAITLAVSVSLKQVRKGSASVQKGHFLVQSAAIVDDVLNLLKKSPEIANISDADSLNVFLSSAALIPFNVDALAVKIEIASVGSKININALDNEVLREAFINYLVRFNVSNPEYLMQLLSDCSHGIKETGYLTDIFDVNPSLYHEKIVSQAHLQEVLNYYVLTQHENSVTKLPWKNLVRFDDSNNTTLDANYLSADVWQLLVPQMDDEEALERSEGFTIVNSVEELGLSSVDATRLTKIDVGFYMPRIVVDIDILENNQSASIAFEYNLESKKGNHFEYGI